MAKMASKTKGTANRTPVTNKEYIAKVKSNEIEKFIDE